MEKEKPMPKTAENPPERTPEQRIKAITERMEALRKEIPQLRAALNITEFHARKPKFDRADLLKQQEIVSQELDRANARVADVQKQITIAGSLPISTDSKLLMSVLKDKQTGLIAEQARLLGKKQSLDNTLKANDAEILAGEALVQGRKGEVNKKQTALDVGQSELQNKQNIDAMTQEVQKQKEEIQQLAIFTLALQKGIQELQTVVKTFGGDIAKTQPLLQRMLDDLQYGMTELIKSKGSNEKKLKMVEALLTELGNAGKALQDLEIEKQKGQGQ